MVLFRLGCIQIIFGIKVWSSRRTRRSQVEAP